MNYDKLKSLYNENEVIRQTKEVETSIKSPKQQANLLPVDEERVQMKKFFGNDTNKLSELNQEKKSVRNQLQNDHLYRLHVSELVANQLKSGVKPQFISNNSLYYNNLGFSHLRAIPSYQISSKMQPLNDQFIKQPQELDMEFVCQQMGYPLPEFDASDIQFFVVDQNTAISYKIQQQQSAEARGVIIFLQDFFDNFVEYRPLFQQIMSALPDYKLLMLNVPG